MKTSASRVRCNTASTSSMYHDIIDTVVVVVSDDTDTLTTPATSAESSPKQQPAYTPHLISPNDALEPLPGILTLTKGAPHHHPLSSSSSSITSYGPTSPPPTIPNFSSLVISVEKIENEESPLRCKQQQQQLKPSPARRSTYRSHRPRHIDPSSFKVARYSVGVLGERGYSAEKPSWKSRRRSTAVAPMRRTKSETLAARRGLHRRDSFASLPRLSDIGIVKEDLVDAVMGMTPTPNLFLPQYAAR